ncbi:hypothetical protein V8C42DRAFT_259940 [Trichoderma barbatum]
MFLYPLGVILGQLSRSMSAFSSSAVIRSHGNGCLRRAAEQDGARRDLAPQLRHPGSLRSWPLAHKQVQGRLFLCARGFESGRVGGPQIGFQIGQISRQVPNSMWNRKVDRLHQTVASLVVDDDSGNDGGDPCRGHYATLGQLLVRVALVLLSLSWPTLDGDGQEG